MRRRALTEGTRDEILAKLDEYGRDRADGPHPNEDKASRIARAYLAIQCGAVEVEFDNGVYRVTDWARPARYLIAEETHEVVLAEMNRYRDLYAGSKERSDPFRDAAMALGYGARAVFADGTLYRVVEE